MQRITLYTFFLILLALVGCTKQNEFLDERYNMADVVPATVAEFQGLLDNDNIMNNNAPSLGLAGTDNVNITDNDLPTLDVWERNAYTWKKDIFEGNPLSEWAPLYTIVRNANIVLEGLSKIGVPTIDRGGYNSVKGSALFFRALAFYHLAQTYAPQYGSDATNQLGIPLRTESDVNVRSVRATLQQTYDQILQDLAGADSLLPTTGAKITRPSKASTYALLAKVYLHMGNYPKAEEFAGKSLAIQNVLLDLNIVPDATQPFRTYSRTHPEYIFYMRNISYTMFTPFTKALVDSNFYKMYEAADIRKKLFFRITAGNPATIHFKGNYTVGIQFGGLATNEMYLILAESQIRQNKLTEGLLALNSLLSKRFTAPYTPKTASTQAAALTLVLNERRKELPFTSQIRWEDLRRLGRDPSTAVTVQRTIGGQTITLVPNDPRYVFPIPDLEIQLSGMQQNPR